MKNISDKINQEYNSRGFINPYAHNLYIIGRVETIFPSIARPVERIEAPIEDEFLGGNTWRCLSGLRKYRGAIHAK